MIPVLLVGLGGAFGSISRYLTSVAVHRFFSAPFYLGTFAVNILGCFLAGILIAVIEKQEWGNSHLRWLLITGFCGGFTTFSAMSLESLTLIKSGRVWECLAFNIASILLGLLVVFVGSSLLR
ncbi:MAG: fluoride efflux transporter CrcB [Fibrobacter sp.]|jgi:CrcB protein|nr:fluoride efflux transporter CrcB [Fibrobacter sp.]